MHLMKWLSGAAVGTALMLAGSPSYAVTIGFSQVGDEGDWRPAFSKDMQDEAKKEGIDLKFADAQGKEEEQLKAVRAFIAQKVDAIIIAPVVVTGWDQVLEEAKKAGIPVFLADRDVDVKDKSLFVTRISADFNLEGRLAGAWTAQASKGQSSKSRARSAPLPRSSARRASKPSPPTSRTSRSSRRSPATSRLTAARRSWKPSSSRPTT
jgi:simple sugar transport system substrate-binding protein